VLLQLRAPLRSPLAPVGTVPGRVEVLVFLGGSLAGGEVLSFFFLPNSCVRAAFGEKKSVFFLPTSLPQDFLRLATCF